MISRRLCVGGLAASAVARVGPAAGQEVPGLSAIARARGFRYGAAPFAYPPVSTPEYDRLIVAQCSMIAPVLNWKAVSPARGEVRVDTDGGVVAFARAYGLDLTGMHLLWHEAAPGWFAGLSGAAEARDEIEGHIARMGAAHADTTWSVNVINEALDPRGGRADGIRNDAFAAQLGSSYLDIAFRAARRAFPRSLLLYNDYGMEQDTGYMLAKRAALLGRLDVLQAAGCPIDGIGLQAHLTLSRPFDAASYAAFLQQIAARRVRIVVTELDVLDATAPAATDARDRAVADLYRRYLRTALGNDAVVGVVTWGLSDRNSWLTAASGPQFARADGLPTRPLPFDDELQPKPAYFAIRDAFGEARQRRLY